MKVENIQNKDVLELQKIELQKSTVTNDNVFKNEQMKEALEQVDAAIKLDDDKLAALDKDKLQELMDGLNRFLLAFDQKFKFRVYDETNTIWVRVLDAKTDQTLREIPSREALQLAAKIRDFVGLLVDQYA